MTNHPVLMTLIPLLTPARLTGSLSPMTSPITGGIVASTNLGIRTPIWIGIILPLIMTVVGFVGAMKVRGIKAPASALVLVFALTVSGIASVAGLALFFNDRQSYDLCVSGVQRSEGNHEMWVKDAGRWGKMTEQLKRLGVDPTKLEALGIDTWQTDELADLSNLLPQLDLQQRCGPS